MVEDSQLAGLASRDVGVVLLRPVYRNNKVEAEVVEQLSGGEMLIRALHDEGVEFIFGYPGGAVLHIYDAIFRQDQVEHILVRHEQAATHAADG